MSSSWLALASMRAKAFPGPGFRGIARLGIPTQRGLRAFSPAHADVIGDGLHEPVEDGIAGKPEDVTDAVRLALAHRLLAAVMAVAADGNVGVGPVPADAADQGRSHPRTSWPDGVLPGRRITATGRQVAVS